MESIVSAPYLYFIATGAIAGLMAGAYGIGGGALVVPALLYFFHKAAVLPVGMELRVAIGSSLAIMIFTAQAAVWGHAWHRKILWNVFQLLWPGILLGTVVGAILVGYLSTMLLEVMLALFIFIVSFEMLLVPRTAEVMRFPRPVVNSVISFTIGLNSGLLGVGGGALIIPYLHYCGVPLRKIPPVSALCTLMVAIIGTIMFYFVGDLYWPAIFWVALASVLCAPLGARLTYILPTTFLKYSFIVILWIAAIGLLI